MPSNNTFVELLETLKGDFELILVGELGWVVEDINPKKRDDGHGEGWLVVMDH